MVSKNTKEQKKLNKKKQYEKSRAQRVRQERREDEKVRLFSRGKNFDFGLLIIVLVLLTVGLVMIMSASSAYSLRTEGDSYYYFNKQLMFAGIGIVIMLIISRLDYRMLNSKLSWLAYIGGLRTNGTSFGSWYWCRKK